MEYQTIFDAFDGKTRHNHWNRLARGAAWVNEGDGLEMVVDNAVSGSLSVAQIDDYIHLSRPSYLWKPPLRLKTRMKASHQQGELLGTAGVGFWNNPAPLWGTRLEVNPNWIWFYYASPQSTIALTDGPTHGWKASIVNAGRGGGVTMALSDRMMRIPLFGRMLSGVRLPAMEAPLERVDFTSWHDLIIEWMPDEISFFVDGEVVLHAHARLDVPLAFVAWLDNNYAALTPDGQFDLGNLAIPQHQTLELTYVEVARFG